MMQHSSAATGRCSIPLGTTYISSSSDSGRSQGKRRILGGRAPVRVALYMATLSAVRWDPPMKAHYQQLRSRGKLGKVALVACMRKLLGIINARRRDELRSEGWAMA